MVGLCASFMDERDIASLISASKADHARVSGPLGMRMVSREHNLEPTVVDFHEPKSRHASYAGQRNLVLRGMDEQGLTWLQDNREVEILTLEHAPEGFHMVHELLWLSRFPRLTSLAVHSDLEDSEPEERQKVLGSLGQAPFASLTSFTIDSSDNDTDCFDLNLAPILAGCKLRHLDLGGIPLCEDSSGSFARNLYELLPSQAETLQSLTVNLNAFDDEGEGLALAAALGNLPGLRRLAFRDWHCCHSIGPEVSAALGQALSRMPALESLDCLGMNGSSEEALGSDLYLRLPASLRRLENLAGIIDMPMAATAPSSAPTPAFRMALERLPNLEELSVRWPLPLESIHALATVLLDKEAFRCLKVTFESDDPEEQKAGTASLKSLAETFTKAGKQLDCEEVQSR
jgi:hypothetical protein